MSDHTTRNSSEVKTCTRCGEVKPLSEFRCRSDSRDGHRADCRVCTVNSDRAWREANVARKAETDRAYYAANAERIKEQVRAWQEAHPEKRAEYAARTRAKHPEKRAEYEARRRARYPERMAARKAVYGAVRRGDFPPASALVCDYCQEAQANHWHHHLGYSPEHWLDVTPACRWCHAEEHR